MARSHVIPGVVNRTWLLASVVACSVLGARAASAYTIETPVTRGCHEEITADILRTARAKMPASLLPLATSRDDRALIDDVAFTVPGDLNDIGGVTLLLGVRDNDVKSFAAIALDQLAALNADPASQKLHCLRTGEEDEPGGSAAAIADCRAFVRETLLSALDGLDENGLPDGNKRDQFEVTLALRGQITVSVPTFYVRAGRGLHTIEDSFTHTFRNVADPKKITVVLNWVDYADNRLDETRDGPPHLTELDRCDDPDALRTERHRLAIEAGAAALGILLAPGVDRAAKGKNIDALLDKYISYDAAAGCTAANHWCDAPENAYSNSACGCVAAGSEVGQSGGFAALFAGVLAVCLRRRKRLGLPSARSARAVRRTWWSHGLASLFVFVAVAASASVAHADEPRPANGPNNKGPLKALEGKSNSGAPNTEDTAGSLFGRVAGGVSYDKPGLSGGLGVRYQLSRPFMLGFDAEWNPYIPTSPTRIRAGSFNAYVSIIRRFQLKNDSLNVRSQLGLGASVLMIDLVGAPAGSYGPFFGLSFLGVEWKVARGFYLTIDPTYIALPVPHITGAPFAYLQYRFLVGLEFGG